MSYCITLIEHLILESLANKAKDFFEISDCTGLKPKKLVSILNAMENQKLIIQNEEKKFHLNKKITDQILNRLHDPYQVKLETMEIVETCLDDKIDSQKECFRLKKFYMSPQEQLYLNGLIGQVEQFVKNCENRQASSNIKDQTILFWGVTKNENIINHHY